MLQVQNKNESTVITHGKSITIEDLYITIDKPLSPKVHAL